MNLKESKNLIVKKSKNGKGIFTRKDFESGTRIFEVKGKFITCDEDEDIDDITRANAYRFDKDKYISPQGRIGDFLNHSCSPNSRVVKINNKLFITALRGIIKGEEIVIDYSTILASDDTWEMHCRCGDKNCRKIIKKFKSLPSKIKKEYIARNIVPSYILKI